MRRLMLFTSLVALLLWGAGASPLSQASDKIKAKEGAPEEQDAMEPDPARRRAWDAKAGEPLEKGDVLQKLITLQLATAEETQGAEVKDILGSFRSPSQGPEPDHDELYHAQYEEVPAEEQPWPQAQLLALQVPWGPEEDRDQVYHPVEAGPGSS